MLMAVYSMSSKPQVYVAKPPKSGSTTVFSSVSVSHTSEAPTDIGARASADEIKVSE